MYKYSKKEKKFKKMNIKFLYHSILFLAKFNFFFFLWKKALHLISNLGNMVKNFSILAVGTSLFPRCYFKNFFDFSWIFFLFFKNIFVGKKIKKSLRSILKSFKIIVWLKFPEMDTFLLIFYSRFKSCINNSTIIQ